MRKQTLFSIVDLYIRKIAYWIKASICKILGIIIMNSIPGPALTISQFVKMALSNT